MKDREKQIQITKRDVKPLPLGMGIYGTFGKPGEVCICKT